MHDRPPREFALLLRQLPRTGQQPTPQQDARRQRSRRGIASPDRTQSADIEERPVRTRTDFEVMPIRPENRSRYPKDWKLRSRFVRFYRANNRCEWCDAANGHPHPETGKKVVLTTAHVYDHRPESSDLLNLAALCQRCHNRHDAKSRHDRRRQRLNRDQLQLFT